MICRSCKFSLQGSEKFCPNCGAPLSEMPKDVTREKITPPEPPRIFFTPVKNEQEPDGDFGVFDEEAPSSDEAPVKKRKGQKKKKSGSKAPVALMLLLLLVILTATLFVAAEHFDVAPAIMQYLELEEKTTSEAGDKIYDYDKNDGIMSPDISYAPTGAYIAKNDSLTLRKGPDDSYGMLMTLKTGCQIQILGGTSLDSMWIYVYVPFYDCYGWLNSSFVTLFSDAENPSEAKTTEEEKTTEAPTEAAAAEETTLADSAG